MTDVTFVGTSDAFASGGRRQSAILLRSGDSAILLDCGPTTNTGLMQLGIDRNEIDAIVISHFHGDHFSGIPALLIAACHRDARRTPLTIAGPQGVERRVRDLAQAMGDPVKGDDSPFEIRFQEFSVDQGCKIGRFALQAFATHHQADSSPHGLIIRIGSHRIAYSGDTGWFDELPERVAGCDLFICECTFWQPGFEFHLDLETLIARKASFDCGRMILTHLGPEMSALRGHCGIETADDGLVLSL
jgi:ribonuclease BN (tRNA processing enzyme)